MEFGGKRTDVVDFGGEMDYSHVKWFQDPPARPAVRNQPLLFAQRVPYWPISSRHQKYHPNHNTNHHDRLSNRTKDSSMHYPLHPMYFISDTRNLGR